MISQNGKYENCSGKPVEPGVATGESGLPVEGVSSKGQEDVAGKRTNPRWTTVTKTPTKELKRIHGMCNGQNKSVEEELRRRGFSSKMLAEVQWEWGQRQWKKSAKKASKISTARNSKARRAKLKRKRDRRRERLRQNRMDLLARLKEGVRIMGENYDPAAADGTCPF
jgi:hypothetical protein